ncbi:MAG: anthranilate phosphoribosyltransferase [Candidatus Margulisbacteria bacterium]|jgi:anthranilate phosphoribosyltransferase|nr:anthranilate phosphoribosyltransferase [Candidatus Margulisiibacteriota bacterium]
MRDLTQVIQKLIDKNTFTQKEAAEIMEYILSGKCSDAEQAAFLTAMRTKGEDQTELLGMAQVIKKYAVPVRAPGAHLIDTCGTGGDLMDTFNISTLAAFVAAAAGARVAKQVYADPEYGCSSVRLLARLGLNIQQPPEKMLKLLARTGITFLYLPLFHPRLMPLVRVSRQVGFRNILNTLFPLSNPLGLQGQITGVFEEKMTTLFSSVLRLLGRRRAFVFHGLEGLDEISISAETRLSELRGGVINTLIFNPEQLGLSSESVSVLQCTDAQDSAQICKIILSGREESARADIVALNAAAAIAASGLAEDLQSGFSKARAILSSGKAWAKLEAAADFLSVSAKKQAVIRPIRAANRPKVLKKKRFSPE